MANMIARLGVVLGLDSAQFVSGVEKASQKLDEFGAAVQKYGAVAATALVAASAAALRFADDMVDVAKANDVAVDSIVKLSNALALSGGKADDVNKLLSSFSGFVDKAADGSLEAQRAFEKVGITLKDLGQLSSTELFDKTLRALAAIEDPVTRNAKAMEILGRAARGVDIRELLNQMEEGKTLAEEQARAIEKAADVYDEITKAGRQFMLMLTSELGTPLKATIDYMKELAGETNSVGQVFRVVFQSIAVIVANVSFVIKTLVQDIAAMGRMLGALLSGDFSRIGEIFREAVSRAEQERARLDQFERNVFGGDGRRGLDDPRIVGRGTAAATGRAVTKAKDPEEEKRLRELQRIQQYLLQKDQEALRIQEQQRIELIQYSDLLQKNGIALYNAQITEQQRIGVQKELLALQSSRNRLLPEEVQHAQEVLIAKQEYARQLRVIAQMEISAEDRRQANLRAEEELRLRLELAEQRLSQIRERRQGSFLDGINRGLREFARQIPTEIERGQAAFESVMENMTSALDRFVQTGKLSFKDLARSIIQDLIRIQLRAQMSSLFSRLFGNLTTAFTYGTNIGSQQTSMLAAQDSVFRADGGPVSGNQPYIVGERGPELFVPRSAGNIVPNHAMAAVGGVTNVTNNYIQAIDVQSFEQRLLGSSNTIWAANQYAQKSLATGRGRT